MQAGYTSLPGPWSQSPRRKTILTVNGTNIPAVPLICCFMILVGLPCWVAGMLQARAGTDDIFKDFDIAADSVTRLKVFVLCAVVIASPLIVMVLVANLLLEFSGNGETVTATTVSRYGVNSYRVNVANWLLLLLAAVMLSGSVTWLSTMSAALSTTQAAGGGGKPWWPPFAKEATAPTGAAAAPTITSPAEQAQLVVQVQQFLAAVITTEQQQRLHQDLTSMLRQSSSAAPGSDSSSSHERRFDAAAAVMKVHAGCLPGCVEPAGVSRVPAPPGHCWCGAVAILDGLVQKLQQIITQLSLAVAGAATLFVASSWLFGYLAAQGAHAERDLQELMHRGQLPLPIALGTDNNA